MKKMNIKEIGRQTYIYIYSDSLKAQPQIVWEDHQIV